MIAAHPHRPWTSLSRAFPSHKFCVAPEKQDATLDYPRGRTRFGRDYRGATANLENPMQRQVSRVELGSLSSDICRYELPHLYVKTPRGGRALFLVFPDAPWTYAVNYANLQGIAPYPAMTLDELKSLPVGDVAAPNSLLLLWATNPLLPSALELIEAWGFRCVSARHTISFCQITMQDSDLQWAGGHFDGDGSVFISKRSNGSLEILMEIVSHSN